MSLIQEKKNKVVSFLVIFLFGVLLNIACIFILAYILFIREYGTNGIPELFHQLIMKPGSTFEILVFGETQDNEIYEKLHIIYSDFKIHLAFWFFYLSFLYLGHLNKKKLVKKDAAEYGSHGSARWANSQEIKESFQKDLNGFVLGEFNRKLAVHSLNSNLNANITVFGGSGTGKSAGFSISNLLYNAQEVGESMIITDPKGELYNTTVPTLRNEGYEILVFNLLDPKRSMRYNPVDYVETIEDAMSLSEMIIGNTGGHGGDPMWSNAEIAYFSSLIMYLKETRPKEEQHIKNILRLGTRIGSDEELLDAMFFALPEDSEALEMYHVFRNAKDKTRAGILIGFGVRLKLWVSNNIAELTSTSDFDINILGQKKAALYLLIPDSDKTFNLLPSLIIDQAFQQLYRQAGRNDNLTLNVRVRCVLDELANIARINDFEMKVSTMRSRGISVVPIFQTITQFKNRYDHDRWSEILGSTDTIVFLGTNDKETAEYFSKKLGPTTLLINSKSESDKHSSLSHSFIRRDLMTPDEIEKLPGNNLIVFQRGKNPSMLNKYFYFKQKKWQDIKKTNWVNDIPLRENKSIKLFDPNVIFNNDAAEDIEFSLEKEEAPVISINGEEALNVDLITGEIMEEDSSLIPMGYLDELKDDKKEEIEFEIR